MHMAAILTFAFAFGSAMYAFSNKYLLVVTVLLFYIIIQKLLSWHRRQKLLHRTIIECGGKLFFLNALFDSGNALIDPISRTPVSIISLKTFLQMFPEVSADKVLFHELETYVKNGRYIEYQTINGKGQLFVFSPDKMQINGTTVQSLLGVSTYDFGSQKYDAILNVQLRGTL